MGNDGIMELERLFLGNGGVDLFKVRQQEDCDCDDNKCSYKGGYLCGNGNKDIHSKGNNRRQKLHRHQD